MLNNRLHELAATEVEQVLAGVYVSHDTTAMDGFTEMLCAGVFIWVIWEVLNMTCFRTRRVRRFLKLYKELIR